MAHEPAPQPGSALTAPGGVGSEAPAGEAAEPARPAEPARRYRQVRFERPGDATEILLVRHGESAEADLTRPFPLLDGRGNPELSPLGRAQARAVARRLAGQQIDAIYVTPLRRTAETAAPLSEQTGIVPIVEPDLVEISLGEWEGGFYRARIAERHPLALEVFRHQRWDLIPGAESNEAVAERTAAAIRRIAAAHRGGRVVAVAHGVAIGTILSTATGAAPFAFILGDNGSISTLVVDGERWLVRRFNDTAHLEGSGVTEELAEQAR